MAVAGSVKPSVQMQVINGELFIGRSAQRIGVVTSVDLAVHRLLDLEVVYVQSYGSLIEQVTRTVNAVLKMRAKNGATGEKETN